MEQFTIQQIVEKAYNHYLITAPNFTEAIEEIKKNFLEFREKAKKSPEDIIPISEIVSFALNEKGKDKVSRHIIAIVGFRLHEEEKYIDEKEMEKILLIVSTELQQFFLPEGAKHIVAVTPKELNKALTHLQIEKVKAKVSIFLLTFYYPLALPYLILEILLFIRYIISIAWKDVKKNVEKESAEGRNTMESADFKDIDIKSIILKAKSRMPKIMDFKYWYHHIMIGVLLWIMILTWILK